MLNSEQEQYKLTARARLVAAGVCHWSQHFEPERVRLGLQLLAEELAGLNKPEIELQIRESLRRLGLHFPELPSLEPSDNLDQAMTEREPASHSSDHQHTSAQSTVLYIRRAPNQVSECTEAFIRDLLGRGFSKSAIARELRLNRRVVIRVAREAESAQQHPKSGANDLGTREGSR